MFQRNQKGFSCIISIIILIFNKLIYPLSSAYVDEQYASCAPLNSTCGPSIDIRYPFWDATRFNYCGHPGFALECQGNSLTIEIKKEIYNVLKINYKSNILTISKQQFVQGPCPTMESELTNTTLDLTLFNFTSNSENASLFYNCERRQGEIAPFGFTCPLNGYIDPTSTNFTSDLNFVAIDKKWKDKLSNMCAIKIDIPVFKTVVADLDKGTGSLSDVVTKGFELKWRIDESRECQVCSAAKGRCGFNHTLGEPICFFPQGSLNNTFSLFNGFQGKHKENSRR
ncbi:LEAF RUST 10 DISEASE-RESISTANCE LOCUS RECEPTOR-LIKE PROTEIN KINASE-like 2.1 [Silene latifolia]|uniref:LEAF RUST 10 DISEASE-RESISTANCE LOCUS RECEPTOR-LIKE PROTEIN KINASE-like 2.1 n=1 Tax=Silene latifolia TaxID=37657 RepID=UPI003D77B1A3